MKTILLVDDDEVVLRAYGEGLTRRGFEVESAGDGLAAVKALRDHRPDAVVLDLKMPRLSGVEVLKFVRSQATLKGLPVVVLSNCYMDELAKEASAQGADQALLKSRCSPAFLAKTISEMLDGTAPQVDASQLLAAASSTESNGHSDAAAPPGRSNGDSAAAEDQGAGPAAKAAPYPIVETLGHQAQPGGMRLGQPRSVSVGSYGTSPIPGAEVQGHMRLAEAPPAPALNAQQRPSTYQNGSPTASAPCTSPRCQFLDAVPALQEDLLRLFHAVTRAPDAAHRERALRDLHRKVHFVAAAAALADCPQLAQMADVFEELLQELACPAARLCSAVLRTLAQTVDFLCLLLARASTAPRQASVPAQVLVIDNDAQSNRLAVSALHRAGLSARSTHDPATALSWLESRECQMVLLGLEIPGVNGFDLCKALRAFPGRESTPVIYLSSHSDFECRAKSALHGGDDFIAKPVSPMELAVKVVLHLLKNR